ncbi:SMI1/KNR4 family protein [Amycolatopsis sp. NBC_00355]|uniref:SMI1/KNR4 family protein n=1 Tax=Amycolatopsis sp. NBC_00355 TaxID=2975957 RepID=UPI002E2716A6
MTWAGVRDRLADLSAADPDFTRFGAGKHRYRLEPPVPAAEIADFEARHGVTLPEEYRGFLLSVGGHGAGPYYGLYRLSAPECPDEDGWRPGFLSTPFPFTEAWNRAEHHPTDNEIPDDLYFDQRWITGSLKVAHFGCGAYFRLVVTGPERGRLWFDDRASDGGVSPCGTGFREWYLKWLDGREP